MMLFVVKWNDFSLLLHAGDGIARFLPSCKHVENETLVIICIVLLEKSAKRGVLSHKVGIYQFLSGGFIIISIVNPPDGKLVNAIPVYWQRRLRGKLI